MRHIFLCVRNSTAPWSIGEHVMYLPFEMRKCVLLVESGRFFGTDMIPAVHNDVFTGALSLIYDVVEDNDIVELLNHEMLDLETRRGLPRRDPPQREPPRWELGS
jgi:hypothetical protein